MTTAKVQDSALKDAIQLLKALELLMRVNAPLTDGVPMHMAVVKFLAKNGVEV